MSIVVQKYGGTSVADPSRIAAVADRVVRTRGEGHDLVVVVSAMGQTTDTLLGLAAEVTDNPHPREMDMLLTAGERISMALLAMALNDRNVPAVSYTGSQAGILTDNAHGGARITRITGERVRDSIEGGKVVIVAGFQGVDPDSREVTTLGRGGSDTTAVALAATLEASSCEILTDVDGVFTADPRLVPQARLLDEVGYDQMHALATAGAGVLMPHSVEFAREHRVPVHVRSSFHDGEGTWVRDGAVSRGFVGLAHRVEGDLAVITVVGDEAASGVDQLMATLAEPGLTASHAGTDELSVSLQVPAEQIEEALRFLHERLFQVEVSP
ncbi:MAG TPA: aspartate kinase [Acidimicrobiia bacterium]|jgi:aspartate kinase|nr:aspartate kinase [Acidimicrobiia bacterium]